MLVDVLQRLFDVQRGCMLDEPLASLKPPLLVTAVAVSQRCARVFGGAGLGDQDLGYRITLRDALLASAAAPTFFPAHQPGYAQRLIDGGVVANASDLVAIVYARRQFALDLDKLNMLSIGTAAPAHAAQTPIGHARADKGILNSLLSRRGLVQLTMDSQERLSTQVAADLLHKRYVRADARPTVQQAAHISDMDRADARANRTLLELADQTFDQSWPDSRFRTFFSRTEAQTR